jgi:ATP synthase assembly factor FMC1, mitochondrial
MAVPSTQARSLYRRFLREMPARSPSLLSNPSPMQKHIRADIAQQPTSSQTQPAQRRLEEAEQFVQYLKAQRMYTTLLERYNPGMNMAEEDRVKATGRRVGMEMPVEFLKAGGRK